MEFAVQQDCKYCNQPLNGKFCSNCGQPVVIKRITISNLLHEVFHFFTHLEKGFPYTLKMLFRKPGKMQREYIEGKRTNHQKPFSMYFISATVLALALYWINTILVNYFDAGNVKEAMFFNKYMVIFLIGAFPISTLVTYLFFFSSSYNFAEIGVMQLYTLSAFFIIVIAINLLKFIWPDIESRYIELPIILLYNALTFVNFFINSKKWAVVLKSILCATLFYLSVSFLQDILVEAL